jgi:endonuclease/exonuclease/phosphatase (EEP) superfamily protein YafD
MPLQPAHRFLAASSDWLAIAIQLLSGGAAIATLLSFAGSVWWGFALLEHGRSQYGWLLLIGLCFALLRLWHWRANQAGMNGQVACGLLWAILLVVNLSYFFGLLLMPSQGAAASSSSKLLTVLHVTLDHDNPDVSQAIAFINQQGKQQGKQQAPDVLSILEVTPRSLPQIQSGLPDYQLAIAEPRTNSHGSAWFVSRHPANPLTVQGSRLIHLPADSDRPLLLLNISYAEKAIELLCFHVIRPRNAETVRYQRVEFQALTDWSQQHPDAIVIGDFNSTPWYGAFRQLLRESQLVSSQPGFGLQPTWHSSLPSLLQIPIDHCLHSRSFVSMRRRVGRSVGSDHLPLSVSLRT